MSNIENTCTINDLSCNTNRLFGYPCNCVANSEVDVAKKKIIVTKHETQDVWVARFEGRKQHVVSPMDSGVGEAVRLLISLETYCDGIERDAANYNVVVACNVVIDPA